MEEPHRPLRHRGRLHGRPRPTPPCSTGTSPSTSGPRRRSRSATTCITNSTGADVPWILADPYRKYGGLEVLFNKRFSNRWQLLASYVYGKATGTIDNGFGRRHRLRRRRHVNDPNFWINAEGNSTNDPTHMIKLQGTYVLPLDINFNAYFRAITGDAWTTRFRTPRFNQGRITFLAEPAAPTTTPWTRAST